MARGRQFRETSTESDHLKNQYRESKGRVEARKGGVNQVARIENGDCDLPVETEAVITDSRIMGGPMHGGRFVDHDGVRLEAEESVSDARGYEEDVAVGGA
jgi:hypothetical protein